MSTEMLRAQLIDKFRQTYGIPPVILTRAPGRIEVLGNHTDYNDGLVLSAAIDRMTLFGLAPRTDTTCRLTAGDLMQTVEFSIGHLTPRTHDTWANYVIGVLAGLGETAPIPHGFDALFFGNIPLGSGLSSSAALEMSAGLAFQSCYDLTLCPLDLARIGQRAEHQFAGVQCGLLDQVSSLFGQPGAMVLTDFRSLQIVPRPVRDDIALLVCDTGTRHALADGDYNERRQDCETAVGAFRKLLDHPVRALRDVSWGEWKTHHATLPARAAQRAAHPIGEIERVIEGVRRLDAGDLAGFGALMFDSHDSSRRYFENSCPELDAVVATARSLPAVLGARLSGGGFGGSAVVLLPPRDAATVATAIEHAFSARFGRPCQTRRLALSEGAGILT